MTAGNNLFWAVLIGLVAGLTSAAFREANVALKIVLTGESADIAMIARHLDSELRIIVPCVGGFLAGLALWMAGKLFQGLRSQDYLEVIRLGNGVISVRPTLFRLLSSLLTISSGPSIGREGGMVQLSALAASIMGRYYQVSMPRLRLMVACGGAAGMASAYNTPLAGALFIAEVVLQSLAIEALGPLIVSSLIAALTIRHWIGIRPIFDIPACSVPMDLAYWPVLGLGLLAGVLAPLFLWILEWVRNGFRGLCLPLPISLALGGALVGLISLEIPEVWGNGHNVVELLLNERPDMVWVLSFLILKVLATSVSVGSGAIGGVFTPTLVIGAALGWIYCYLWQMFWPHDAMDVVTGAALGMGAFLSATIHAPITAVMMIFEMTLNSNLLLPLIAITIISRYISAAIRPNSVYSQALGVAQSRLPYLMHVADLQTTPSAVVSTHVLADQVSEMFCFSSLQHIWVVDESGQYQGQISLHAMKRFLGDESLAHIQAVHVFMEDDLPVLSPDCALTDALSVFAGQEADRLPVVGSDRRLLGEISKTDLLLMLGVG